MITVNNLEPTFSTFPNGEVNVKFQPSLERSLDEAPTAVKFKFDSNEELIKLGLVLNLLETYPEVEDVHVDIPFLPYSRMDRHEEGYHNPLSLKVVLNILKGYGKSLRFPVVYETTDVHNKDMFYRLTASMDSTTRFVNDIPVKDHLATFAEDNNLNLSDILVVFPDKGAKARYDMIDFSRMPTPIVGKKTRDFETHAITGYALEGDITKNAKHIVIVDDVVSYGGTFIKLIKAIKEKTTLPISIITSHAEDALWRGDLLEEGVPVYTTHTLNHHTESNDNLVHFFD